MKYAVLEGGEIFDLMAQGVDDSNLERLVDLCVDCKRRVVEEDENENGTRRLLNLGHTLGRQPRDNQRGAAAQGVPLVETSHQQGHIRAALVDSGCGEAEFVALHLSGGTTEAVFVGQGLKTRLIAMSADLHAGQLVDRVGVALGMSFPAGPALEALARQGSAKGAMPLSHRDNQVSLSGAEAQAMRMIAAGVPGADVAAEVYSYLSRAVAKLIEIAVRETGAKQVLLGGGVASSALLRELLPARLKRNGLKVALCWGKPEYSGDNAVGVALIGYDRLTREDVQ